MVFRKSLMQIAIAGSEAQRPFGDPPRNLKNQRSDVVSCPKTRKKKIALSYIVFAIVAVLSLSTTVNTIHSIAHQNAKSS
jgi:hypothetical protein